MTSSIPTYLNVLMVEEFTTTSGQSARSWTKIGVAFPHADGRGYNVELRAFPQDGRLVLLPPASDPHSGAAPGNTGPSANAAGRR